jgi:hypothetical protein
LGPHVSEASAERFVFGARAGPLCPAESSKMQLCGRFCMTTKSPTLNQCFCAVISLRIRKARANEAPLCFRCAASLRLRCAHTLTCIIRGLYFHVSTGSYMSKVWSSCPPCTVQPWRKSLRKSFVIITFLLNFCHTNCFNSQFEIWLRTGITFQAHPGEIQKHCSWNELDRREGAPRGHASVLLCTEG